MLMACLGLRDGLTLSFVSLAIGALTSLQLQQNTDAEPIGEAEHEPDYVSVD
jgi:hypothetical protein